MKSKETNKVAMVSLVDVVSIVKDLAGSNDCLLFYNIKKAVFTKIEKLNVFDTLIQQVGNLGDLLDAWRRGGRVKGRLF